MSTSNPPGAGAGRTTTTVAAGRGMATDIGTGYRLRVFSREDSGTVAVVRMAHGKVSALDREFCDAMVAMLDEVVRGPARALVVTGTGSTFSAGVDLFRVLDGGPAYLAGFLPSMDSFLRALVAFPKPVVAAVNGHAVAGGCVIAAACDHRVMASGAGRIGVPELIVGVPFPPLPFEIVAARVGRQVFRQLVISGRMLLPADAAGVGLIDEVVGPDALLPRAQEVAGQMARIPAATFALTKRAFTDPLLERVRAAAPLNEAVVEAWSSPEVTAGIREYLEATLGRSR